MPAHASNKNHRGGWKRRIGTAAAVGVLAALALAARMPMGPASRQDALLQGLLAGQKSLQAGMNTWDPVQFLAARDQFLGLLIGQDNPAKIYPYHVGLADFRLATYYLATGNAVEAGRFAVEGESYFEMAAKSDPKFAEALALQGYLLGLEAALHPDQAMTYGMQSMQYLNRGLALEPDNPRIQYLNGSYLLYVPEAFGGGADRAIEALAKAAALFEKETAVDPLKPSWGKDETLTYLGMAYVKKNDTARARECFRKALAVNPAFGLAKSELAKIEK